VVCGFSFGFGRTDRDQNDGDQHHGDMFHAEEPDDALVHSCTEVVQEITDNRADKI